MYIQVCVTYVCVVIVRDIYILVKTHLRHTFKYMCDVMYCQYCFEGFLENKYRFIFSKNKKLDFNH